MRMTVVICSRSDTSRNSVASIGTLSTLDGTAISTEKIRMIRFALPVTSGPPPPALVWVLYVTALADPRPVAILRKENGWPGQVLELI